MVANPCDLGALHDFFPFDLDMSTLVLALESCFGVKTPSLQSAIYMGRQGVMYQTLSLVGHVTGDIEACWG